jgi:hypothetical protein
MTNNNITFPEPMISREALALLGGGKIAYVKTIRSEDVRQQFPQAPQLAPGTLLYALHAADGMEVLGADLKNGLLSIDLARPEPERIVKTISIADRD